MFSDWIWVAVLSTVFLGGIAVVVGAWLPKEKKLPDWFMAVGGTMALVAFGSMIALSFGWLRIRVRGEEIAIVFLSTTALGILLFSMGYVMDRWARRRGASLPMQVR